MTILSSSTDDILTVIPFDGLQLNRTQSPARPVAWAYPTMTCTTDVTILTSERTGKNRNLMRAIDGA
ncbi:unnamed protein product, partial [Adineta ricciae]